MLGTTAFKTCNWGRSPQTSCLQTLLLAGYPNADSKSRTCRWSHREWGGFGRRRLGGCSAGRFVVPAPGLCSQHAPPPPTVAHPVCVGVVLTPEALLAPLGCVCAPVFASEVRSGLRRKTWTPFLLSTLVCVWAPV